MKNKTIEILADGEHMLPKGLVINTRIIEKNPPTALSEVKWIVEFEGDKFNVSEDSTHAYEVDLSSKLEPLFPHKGMEVPEEGIEFADGDGVILDASNTGLTYKNTKGDIFHHLWSKHDLASEPEVYDGFIIPRTLPATITVCANGCFKEVCECVTVKQMTTLDVMYFWEVVKSSSSILLCEAVDVDNYDLSFDFRIDSEVSEWRWNELVHENGETKLKHDTWQEFTFENCPINVIPEGVSTND
jgi:hypothetical protein